ncbi:MAG TPA: hypothetical protein VII01_16100 [Solirubrobacteraceae bacterium]|jgi:hypothetical protein
MSAVPDAPARSGLERLCELLHAGGGLMATLVSGEEGAPLDGGAERSPAVVAAAGPRTAARAAEYELLVEAIYEGYLLHYASPRVVRVPEADLGLLAGDQLYALGLARLIDLGDTIAVAELADTITLSALAQGDGNPALADVIWEAGARAVGWGPSEEHRRAKELVCAGSPGAIEAMRTSARAAPAPR